MACCDLREAHYHCAECNELAGMTGHYVKSAGRFICDQKERFAYWQTASQDEEG